MKVHIGNIIQFELKKSGVSVKELAVKKNTSPSNIYNMFKRETMDMDELTEYSIVLNVNLFRYYQDIAPIHELIEEHTAPLKEQIENLKELLKEKEAIIRDKNIVMELMAEKYNVKPLQKKDNDKESQ